MTEIRHCSTCGTTLPPNAHHNRRYCSSHCKYLANREALYASRAYYFEHGICYLCGQNEVEKGRKICTTCRLNANDNRNVRHEKWYRKKLCLRCGGKRDRPGKTLCAACAEKVVEIEKRKRKKRIAQGLCTVCGKRPPVEGLRYCGTCSLKHIQKMERYRGRRSK